MYRTYGFKTRTWVFFSLACLTLVAAACEGPTGPPGRDGTNGSNGTDGLNGANGTDGRDCDPCQPADFMDTEDRVIAVESGDCGELIAAIRGLDGRFIAADATVTIQVSGASYACTEPLVFKHRDGARIHVVGNASGAPTTLNFAEGVDGVVVEAGYALGRFDGFLLSGAGTQAASGITVKAQGHAVVGPEVEVEDFTTSCYLATDGGTLKAAGTIARQCNHGYSASHGARILASGAQAVDCTKNGFLSDSSGLVQVDDAIARRNGDGFHARFTGSISALRALADSNDGRGFFAENDAYIRANGSTARQNGGVGFDALHNSHVNAFNATAEDNVGLGIRAAIHSYIQAVGSASTGNGGGGYAPMENTLSLDGTYLNR